MAQFDVYRLASGELVVDCQSDLVSRLINTRLVVPLFDPDGVPDRMQALHPQITVGETAYLLATQYAAAIPGKELAGPIHSLERDRYLILNALDFLLTGV